MMRKKVRRHVCRRQNDNPWHLREPVLPGLCSSWGESGIDRVRPPGITCTLMGAGNGMLSGSACAFKQRGQQGYLQAVSDLLTDVPPAETGILHMQSLTLAAVAEG